MNRATETNKYLYGDHDLAAQRLALLAAVFAPSMREFLRQFVSHAPRSICDVGCGPGHTTRILADEFPNAEVMGVDSSQQFLALARQTSHERVSFALADASGRLPGGPYDLIYCRYLLTHLARPVEALELWADALRPQGLIAIEENDWIATEQPAFAHYLRMAELLLEFGGSKLYVGRELDAIAAWPTLVRQTSELIPIPVNDQDIARIFLLNLRGLRGGRADLPASRFIAQRYSQRDLDELQTSLERLAGTAIENRSITFGRRRLVLKKGLAT